MRPDAINAIGNTSGIVSGGTGLVGWAAQYYSAIYLGISAATFVVFVTFKILHYQLEKNRDKDTED